MAEFSEKFLAEPLVHSEIGHDFFVIFKVKTYRRDRESAFLSVQPNSTRRSVHQKSYRNVRNHFERKSKIIFLAMKFSNLSSTLQNFEWKKCKIEFKCQIWSKTWEKMENLPFVSLGTRGFWGCVRINISKKIPALLSSHPKRWRPCPWPNFLARCRWAYLGVSVTWFIRWRVIRSAISGYFSMIIYCIAVIFSD